jgi:hypothetical protein
LKSFRAPGHDFAHLDGCHTPLKVGGDEDNGLGRVVKHDFHLVAVVDALVYVFGQKLRHDKLDLGQRVLEDNGFLDILTNCSPSLASAMVENVEAVRTTAVIGVVSPGADGHLTVAIV